MPAFVDRVKRGERPTIYGDGTISRDFCYVENVVRALLLAATHDGDATGEAYNVACGAETSLNELVTIIGEFAGKPDLVAEYAPPRVGDIPRSLADISKIERELDYRCMIDVREGLRLTMEWAGALAEQWRRRGVA